MKDEVPPKRKVGSLGVLLDAGLVKEGELLRYITVRVHIQILLQQNTFLLKIFQNDGDIHGIRALPKGAVLRITWDTQTVCQFMQRCFCRWSHRSV
jgi:hypothetical protein